MEPKIAGKKLGTIEAVKASLKKGGGSTATYIKYVPEDGLVVRFLTEPEEWFGYQEYYDAENKMYVPMVEGEVLPDDTRPSFRYLTNALIVAEDTVVPLKLPKTLANLLMISYEKYDSISDRNYELDKHGTGIDTTYVSTPEAPSKMNTSKYELLDLALVLEQTRRMAEGSDPFDTPVTIHSDDIDDTDSLDDTDADDTEAFAYEDLYPDDTFRVDYTLEELSYIYDQGDLDELLEDWELDPSIKAKKSDQIAAILNLQNEYGEEDDDDDEDSDEEVVYDEDELDEMSLAELRGICDHIGVEHSGLKRQALIDSIIEESEE
jgi:hypothetical protein